MEFSQYIIDAITSIDYVEKNHDITAVSLIRKASENAPNNTDSHILDVIAGAATMQYKEKERSFGPHVFWNDGSRSFASEDFLDNDLDILSRAIRYIGSLYLRTKFSHIIWSINKHNQYGKKAVEGYVDLFQDTFNPDEWVVCYEHIRSAYHIASVMGKTSDSYKGVLTVINQKLFEMNGSDPLFLSLNLLELVIGDAPKEFLARYDAIVCILVDKNLNPDSENTHLADSSFSVLEKLYGRMKKGKELKVIKNKYANYYEIKAKCLAQRNDYFRAVIMLKKSCTIYSGINQEKLLELRLLLEDWQKAALQEMHVHKYEIDCKPIYNAVEKMFEGLSLPEAIVQFGRVAKIYHVEEVKKKLSEEQKEFVFSSLFGSSLLNELGQSVQEIPPMSDISDNQDTSILKKHMVRYVAEQRRLIDVIPVGIAFRFLSGYGTITEDDLDFLIHDNSIIPENRVEIVKQGICMGLNGKLYAAMHILQPQTENIFRNLVKICGDTVTFLKDDGTEEYKPLSSLFKSEKLRECYDEDIIFTFQSIMDEPTGENLRNLNGHGLLEPELGNSAISLCFLSLLIFLLSLYGIEACSIRRNLVQREQQDTDEQG